MKTNDPSSKKDVDASRDESVAAKINAKITEIADRTAKVAEKAQDKIAEKAAEGGHRLQESAEKVGHIAKEIDAVPFDTGWLSFGLQVLCDGNDGIHQESYSRRDC